MRNMARNMMRNGMCNSMCTIMRRRHEGVRLHGGRTCAIGRTPAVAVHMPKPGAGRGYIDSQVVPLHRASPLLLRAPTRLSWRHAGSLACARMTSGVEPSMLLQLTCDTCTLLHSPLICG